MVVEVTPRMPSYFVWGRKEKEFRMKARKMKAKSKKEREMKAKTPRALRKG